MTKTRTNRAASTASRNLPKLKSVIKYDFRGIRNTPDTLYWGGRWPDDFFLGTRASGEAPKQTDIADVMDWLANLHQMAKYGNIDGHSEGELGMEVLFRAASLELRLPPVSNANETN